MRWIYGFEMPLRNLKGLGIYEKINKKTEWKQEEWRYRNLGYKKTKTNASRANIFQFLQFIGEFFRSITD